MREPKGSPFAPRKQRLLRESGRLLRESGRLLRESGRLACESACLACFRGAKDDNSSPNREPIIVSDKPEPLPLKSPHLLHLGTMTVFYVPSHKLDDPRFYGGSQTARSSIHEYLMHRYRAYTQTPTPVKGFWVDPAQELVHDVMERFEVSFGVESEFDRLIEFLAGLCEDLQEEAIYVTRGDESYLVTRFPQGT